MASTIFIRVSTSTRDLIAKLAAERGLSPGDVVDLAVGRLEKEWFWKQDQEGYARLKADPEAWEDFQQEMREWDATLLDGLSASPYDEMHEDK